MISSQIRKLLTTLRKGQNRHNVILLSKAIGIVTMIIHGIIALMILALGFTSQTVVALAEVFMSASVSVSTLYIIGNLNMQKAVICILASFFSVIGNVIILPFIIKWKIATNTLCGMITDYIESTECTQLTVARNTLILTAILSIVFSSLWTGTLVFLIKKIRALQDEEKRLRRERKLQKEHEEQMKLERARRAKEYERMMLRNRIEGTKDKIE